MRTITSIQFKLPQVLTYEMMLEGAKFENSPIRKKMRELRNRIKKRRNKKKSKKYYKWKTEYRNLKSSLLIFMYSRPSNMHRISVQ